MGPFEARFGGEVPARDADGKVPLISEYVLGHGWAQRSPAPPRPLKQREGVLHMRLCANRGRAPWGQ